MDHRQNVADPIDLLLAINTPGGKKLAPTKVKNCSKDLGSHTPRFHLWSNKDKKRKLIYVLFIL